MSQKHEKHMTLDRFLARRQEAYPGATGELTRVIMQVGVVAKIISSYMRRAALDGLRGLTGDTNVQGEDVKILDQLGNTVFMDAFDYVDIVGAIVSEELNQPTTISHDKRREKYVVLVDPIDGSSNLDVDCVIGSIFSIRGLGASLEDSILRAGNGQIAAGYIMYGTSVMLVYTAGEGVHSFVLDEEIGEFVLDHENIRMPDRGGNISANFGNYAKWAQPARSFADAMTSGEDGKYSLRYSGALVADLHQILHRGGIYFYPADTGKPGGKLRLLYECAPLAMIARQAGGDATTGKERVMEIKPEKVHQRIPFAIGSMHEISKFEEIHRKHQPA